MTISAGTCVHECRDRIRIAKCSRRLRHGGYPKPHIYINLIGFYGLDEIFIFGDIYLNKLKNSTKENVFWRENIPAIDDLIVKGQPFNFT